MLVKSLCLDGGAWSSIGNNLMQQPQTWSLFTALKPPFNGWGTPNGICTGVIVVLSVPTHHQTPLDHIPANVVLACWLLCNERICTWWLSRWGLGSQLKLCQDFTSTWWWITCFGVVTISLIGPAEGHSMHLITAVSSPWSWWSLLLRFHARQRTLQAFWVIWIVILINAVLLVVSLTSGRAFWIQSFHKSNRRHFLQRSHKRTHSQLPKNCKQKVLWLFV